MLYCFCCLLCAEALAPPRMLLRAIQVLERPAEKQSIARCCPFFFSFIVFFFSQLVLKVFGLVISSHAFCCFYFFA
uniref:Uncharacterized protein n=1 Tax=Ixodes ricinus TaxID=34613 RepID=A0A147BNB4_IXORI